MSVCFFPLNLQVPRARILWISHSAQCQVCKLQSSSVIKFALVFLTKLIAKYICIYIINVSAERPWKLKHVSIRKKKVELVWEETHHIHLSLQKVANCLCQDSAFMHCHDFLCVYTGLNGDKFSNWLKCTDGLLKFRIKVAFKIGLLRMWGLVHFLGFTEVIFQTRHLM